MVPDRMEIAAACEAAYARHAGRTRRDWTELTDNQRELWLAVADTVLELFEDIVLATA